MNNEKKKCSTSKIVYINNELPRSPFHIVHSSRRHDEIKLEIRSI